MIRPRPTNAYVKPLPPIVNRRECDFISHDIEPLDKSHDPASFSCGSAALDRYLRQQARQDAEKRVAAPFVLVEPPELRVLGYYTLSASVLDASELPDILARKLPRYPQLPVTLLGRLAIDQSMKGNGMGQFLLMDALRRSLEAATNILISKLLQPGGATARSAVRWRPRRRGGAWGGYRDGSAG